MYRVFVYGTLKRDMPNNNLLRNVYANNGEASFIAVGRTVDKFPLIVEEKYGIPFLLDKPGAGKVVQGEVWQVDEKMLCRLDKLEGHPTWYTRRVIDISVEPVEAGQLTKMNCWTYILGDFREDLLDKDHLTNYEVKYYVKPSDRPADFELDIASFKTKKSLPSQSGSSAQEEEAGCSDVAYPTCPNTVTHPDGRAVILSDYCLVKKN